LTKEINDEVYFGSGHTPATHVSQDTLYFKQEWANAYAQYDPTEANRLLDEVGLDKRDVNGTAMAFAYDWMERSTSFS
jgi:peptide/nickel transport system substrate-binding protein